MQATTVVFDSRGYMQVEQDVYDDPASLKEWLLGTGGKPTPVEAQLVDPVVTLSMSVVDGRLVALDQDGLPFYAPFGNVHALLG